ncbi:hypothetical protein BDP27DRAFT_1433862 [Rhodocollybia butyracea]|uniref:Uncharacterized protein n=1 Tax=Rhodocollybia butyracea TaxID=206335 RepID=A0A9P5P356_9AGAR|nr:hypothetical protein BDP27DRAFT_1433862 [Rhodocollybia butyracea]
MHAITAFEHFKKGISLISQWTGNEYKNMEKVFLGVLAGTAPPNVVIYESLEKMDNTLRTFHQHKHSAFVEPGIRNHFKIPKIHAMNHYVPMIRSIGVAPRFNTELSERLHIDFAKLGYQASNKRDYIKQMTLWLDRREKVLWFTRFLDWALDKDDIDWLDTSNTTNDSEDGEAMGNMAEAFGESKCLVEKSAPLLNIDLETLSSTYGCSSFVYTIEKFLCQHNLLKLDYWDATPAKYDLYKRVCIIIPPTPEISDLPFKDTESATGKSEGKFGCTRANGLHVAQVHAIFNLPEELGTFAHPLAYVEWFTPLQKFDKDTLMYQVERSSGKGVHAASIIPLLNQILCHPNESALVVVLLPTLAKTVLQMKMKGIISVRARVWSFEHQLQVEGKKFQRIDDSQKESQEYYSAMEQWSYAVQQGTATIDVSNAKSADSRLDQSLDGEKGITNNIDLTEAYANQLNRDLYIAEHESADLREENGTLQDRNTALEDRIASLEREAVEQEEEGHTLKKIMARTSDIFSGIATGSYDSAKFLGHLNMYLISQLESNSQSQS